MDDDRIRLLLEEDSSDSNYDDEFYSEVEDNVEVHKETQSSHIKISRCGFCLKKKIGKPGITALPVQNTFVWNIRYGVL